MISAILAAVVVMVGADLWTDTTEGVRWWHVLVEGGAAFGALIGIFIVLRGSFQLKRTLTSEREESARLRVQADEWRLQSKRYLDGLSSAIDQQLTAWKLTESEKEVVFLLLKGLSLKEIADVRQTHEKTARAQSISAYAKAGLAGRSELAAFFLEDLLPPQAPKQG